jgi:hypothetical protein
VEKIDEEIHDMIIENNITIDDSFIQRRSNYKTADELFGAKDRETVKLLKELQDEKSKSEKLVKFTHHCVHLIKRFRKCKFCKL